MFRTPVHLTELSRNKGSIMFDRITQTLEREFFEYLLDLEVKKAVRYLYFFSLMILQKDTVQKDLDREEEDTLLKRLAILVREEIRGTDIIGRIGHDKFFIVLDQADFQASFKVGERIKDRVEHYGFRVDGQTVTLTASIGVACFPTHASDLVALIQKAEGALNLAREGGGGRVCLPE
ncbi:MAG: GGDEF domain-containing protein [Nitrospirae bacterium]|nr:GGDEF domain-containing protein [Nitrospirota bacterium]